MNEYETEYSKICIPSALGMVLIPGTWNITQSKKLCLSIRGGMNVISNAENSQEMETLLGKSTTCQNLGDFFHQNLIKLCDVVVLYFFP